MKNARQVALDILDHLQRGDQPLDYWLEKAEPQIAELKRPDRALVHALVYGTLRWKGRLDFIIDQLAQKPAKIDPLVRTILEMALFQLNHLDRIPDSAAVHTAVDLAKTNGRKWAAGFVNGLLRRSAAVPSPIRWPEEKEAPHELLSVEQALPYWLARRWIERYGLAQARLLGSAINTIPRVTLRTNTLKADRSDLMRRIEAEAQTVAATRYSPEGIQIASLARPLRQWPAYQDGWFQVQDEAAQLVSHLLAPVPGETVWDACAGLGTKTAHLAQLMNNQGVILASDVHPHRLAQLKDDMQRLGIAIVTPRIMDLTGISTDATLPEFDRILVDAPCSGLGVLQKNPDGKWRVSEADISRSAQRQTAILERMAPRLRPGGRLVYAVCSFEPEENEGVIEAFLQKHPEFAIDIPKIAGTVQANRFITPQGYSKTLPHLEGMDGFFAAVLIKAP